MRHLILQYLLHVMVYFKILILFYQDALKQNKEKTKLRMRLIGEHKRCETFRDSYKDLAYEMKLMEEKFEAVIAEQKKHLGKYAGEILKLKELSRNAAGQQE